MDFKWVLWEAVGLLLDWRFYSVLLFIIFAIIWIGLKVQEHLDNGKSLTWHKYEKISKEKSIRRVEDIPLNRFLPFWTPIWLFEGFATIYQALTVGIPFIDPVAKRNGPIVRMYLFFYDFLFVTDINLVQKILLSTNPILLNKTRKIYTKFFVEWLENGLLASERHVWQPHRKILSYCFTYKALATYSKVMDKHGKALAKALEDACSPDGTIQGDLMTDLIAVHSIRIIAEIVVGTKSSAFLDTDGFFEVFKKAKKLLMSKVIFENLLKPIWPFTKQKNEYDGCMKALRAFIKKDIEIYKKDMEEKKELGGEGEEVKEEIEGERPFRSVIEQMLKYNPSEEEIYDEVGRFMSARHETTSGAIHFFLQHMGEHPEIQERCKEELDMLYASKGEGLSRPQATLRETGGLLQGRAPKGPGPEEEIN